MSMIIGVSVALLAILITLDECRRPVYFNDPPLSQDEAVSILATGTLGHLLALLSILKCHYHYGDGADGKVSASSSSSSPLALANMHMPLHNYHTISHLFLQFKENQSSATS